jgi:hypothetical protein
LASRAAGWLALPAVILAAVSQFQTELAVLHVRVNWFPFGLRISLAQISMLALVLVLLVLLIRRLLLSLRRQKELALDVKQAQEVQQVILPGAITWLPGFAIESGQEDDISAIAITKAEVLRPVLV